MKYFFVTVGGSGSTYLLKCLGKKYKVDSKPDTYFIRHDEPFTQRGKKMLHQRLLSFDEKPKALTCTAFYDRTGYKLLRNLSIDENLVNYLKHLRSKPKKTAIFNAAAKFGFFSRNNTSGFVALIRHPLYAYTSYTKKERHLNLAQDLGGVDTFKAIDYYARSWNAVVSECLRLPDAKVIRYEFADKDAKFLKMDFSGWKTNNRSVVKLKKSLQDRLRYAVWDKFSLVYNKWD